MNITQSLLEKQYKRVIEQFLVGDCTISQLRSKLLQHGCSSVSITNKGRKRLCQITTKDKMFYYEIDSKNISLIGVRTNALVTS